MLESKINRNLNKEALGEFISNGFINGKETLLENVNKLIPFHYLKVDKNGVDLIFSEPSLKEYSQEEASSLWCPVLDKAIKKSVKDENNINITISGGYDSNYILHVLNKEIDSPINAFSIGAKQGNNELPVVKENMKSYPKVNLHTGMTDSNALQFFPDIVWRLEGNVYERGIFLQYSLANLLNKNNVRSIILGECADQIMNLLYWESKSAKKNHYLFLEDPFTFGSMLILKKNGILCNSYDIDTNYPFLNKEFLPIAHALRNKNQYSKEFHKEVCRKILNPNIIDNISKVGGATDVVSLFDSKESSDKIIKYIKGSNVYKENHKYFHYQYPNYENRNLKAKAKDSIKTLCFNTSSSYSSQKAMNRKEHILRNYLCYLYIILFEELIISGKYDDNFLENGISTTLNEILFK